MTSTTMSDITSDKCVTVSTDAQPVANDGTATEDTDSSQDTLTDEEELYFSGYSDDDMISHDYNRTDDMTDEQYEWEKRTTIRFEKLSVYQGLPDELKDKYISCMLDRRNARDYTKCYISREDDKDESVTDLSFDLQKIRDEYRLNHSSNKNVKPIAKDTRKDTAKCTKKAARPDTIGKENA